MCYCMCTNWILFSECLRIESGSLDSVSQKEANDMHILIWVDCRFLVHAKILEY